MKPAPRPCLVCNRGKDVAVVTLPSGKEASLCGECGKSRFAVAEAEWRMNDDV